MRESEVQKESANGTDETQTAERSHRTLQPFYSRRDQPPSFHGRRQEICRSAVWRRRRSSTR